jgi:hypothetical protein
MFIRQYVEAQGHKLPANGLTLLEFTLCGIWSMRLRSGNIIVYDTAKEHLLR